MRTAIKITTLLGLPAAVGLSVLSEPIMTVLFYGSAPGGAGLLMILGLAAYFGCLVLITNAILQAFGHERLPIFTVATGGLLKIIIDLSVVGNPDIGIYGAAFGTLICYIAISVLNLIYIKRVLPKAPGYLRLFFKPVVCSAVMGAAAFFSYPVFFKLIGAITVDGGYWIKTSAGMSASILFAVIVYLTAITVTKTLTRDEVFLMPGGRKLAKILKIR
jgi:stage V sporulation protein B